jgi:hypothetical protein
MTELQCSTATWPIWASAHDPLVKPPQRCIQFKRQPPPDQLTRAAATSSCGGVRQNKTATILPSPF